MDTITRWSALVRGDIRPEFIELCREHGEHVNDKVFQVWSNDRYEIVVRIYPPDGFAHLSIKRYDRDTDIPFGFNEGAVLMSQAANEAFNDTVIGGKGKQRHWEAGLTTGLGDGDKGVDEMVQFLHKLDDETQGRHWTKVRQLIDYLRGGRDGQS